MTRRKKKLDRVEDSLVDVVTMSEVLENMMKNMKVDDEGGSTGTLPQSVSSHNWNWHWVQDSLKLNIEV